jgi:hypothetical protein
VADHPTFSRNRHGRFRQSDILRHLFETVVQRCLREGLVDGEGFAVDASLIAADANKQRSVPGDQWRIGRLDADAGRAVREYLATLDDVAFGAASEVKPKFVSPSDPAAQWTGAHKGHAFFAYATNYLIDTENAVILDVEASRAICQAEVGAFRTARRFGITPRHLAADSAMARPRTWHGWLRSVRSNRTSRCSTSPTGPTALSPDPTSCSTPEEGRDAVRPSQAHPQTRSPQIARSSGARDEFLLAAIAQNLRKLAKLRAMPAACPVPA